MNANEAIEKLKPFKRQVPVEALLKEEKEDWERRMKAAGAGHA